MKRSVLCTCLLAASTLLNAQTPEDKIRRQAKKEGITEAEWPFYLKREKARAEGTWSEPTRTHHVHKTQANMAARTSTGSTSACSNLDFEDANYNNWSIFVADNYNSAGPPSNVITDLYPGLSGANLAGDYNAVIDSANSMEPNSSISLPSNYAGKHIARVNHIGNGAKVGILERQINVTSGNPFLNFSYAAFLEDAGHTAADQPYLNIIVLDTNNNAVPGASLNIVATTVGPNPGFAQVTLGALNYFYKAWTPVSIDLSAYIGQMVTLQVIASDCVPAGHGGHAYIDFDCGGPTAGVPNVWPGDANYDLNVDFLDLFYVGAGNGLTGTARTTPGNAWAASPSTNWNQNSLYLVDAKHADCNGDGTIDAQDTVAIYLNYGLTHAFKSNHTSLVAESTAAPKPVTVQSSANTIYAGQPFTLSFNLGNTSALVDSIYAIGFSMSYPDQLLDNASSAMSCNASVISSPSGLLNIFKPTTGSADLAVTKTNQANAANVQGSIFSLNLQAAQNIGSDANFNFSLSNMKAITRSGANIPLAGVDAQVTFKASTATGIKVYSADKYSVYPNPAQTKITISAPGATKIEHYEIYSVSGELIKSNTALTEKLEINVSDLSNGCYLVKLKSDNGSVVTKRFIKS